MNGVLLAIVFTSAVGLCLAAQPRAATGGDVRQKAEARMKAAMEVVAALQEREVAAEPLTPEFAERKLRAYRKLAESRLELASNPAQRLEAAQGYLEQTRQFAGVLEARRGEDVGRVQLTEAQYHVAEAEHWVAKIQSGQ